MRRFGYSLLCLALMATAAPAVADETEPPSQPAESVVQEETPTDGDEGTATEPVEVVPPVSSAAPSQSTGSAATGAEDSTRAELEPADVTPEGASASSLREPTVHTPKPRMIGVPAEAFGQFSTTSRIQVWGEVRIDDTWMAGPRVWTDAMGNYRVSLDHGNDQAGTYVWRIVALHTNGTRQETREFTYQRLPSVLTVHTPKPRPAGVVANMTGNFMTTGGLTVWSETQLPDGSWRRISTTRTVLGGNYSLPLNYRMDSAATTTWRVKAQRPDGSIQNTHVFTYVRYRNAATVFTPKPRPVFVYAEMHGRFATTRPIQVWGEVKTPTGRWSPTPKVWTDAKGNYRIPLNYGKERAGVYTWRVSGRHTDGTIERTRNFTYRRLAPVKANAVVTRTTAAEVAKHYRAGCPMGPSRLRTIRINYYDYNGNIKRGEIIVRSDRANDVVAAFTESFNAKFPIFQMRNPNAWGGKDTAMMAANNTSGFNCRKVVGNPYSWSPHAYGIAVDINPAQNPYRDPSGKWWPQATYATKRPRGVKGMLYDDSPPVRALKSRGWMWGRGWDWHHFQKSSR